VTIEPERIERGRELADIAGLRSDGVDAAILAQHENYRPDRRNMVSTLASVAQLAALLGSMSEPDRKTWLEAQDDAGLSNRARLLSGAIADVCAQLSEHLAEHFDVVWDGNWPDEKVRTSLKGRVPPSARPGDVLVGGDYGGARIDIRIVDTSDGEMTGEVVQGTFRDGPATDVWSKTYSRLAGLYPEEIPH